MARRRRVDEIPAGQCAVIGANIRTLRQCNGLLARCLPRIGQDTLKSSEPSWRKSPKLDQRMQANFWQRPAASH